LVKQWSEWSEDYEIKFPFLPSGTYTLEVKAKNVFGNESNIQTIEIEVERPFWQTWWFYSLIILVLIFIIYLIIKIRTQQLKRANELLQEKIDEATAEIRNRKDELEVAYKDIEKKNQHITESINYAKKIQEAILPYDENIRNAYNGAFVFFKPRDIVSGDFYWFQQRDGKSIIVAADCTGHGVPGAFMSMIGNTLLNQIIKEKGITDPAEILENLDLEIVNALKQDQTSDSLTDGMDISICVVHNNKKTIEFAGAKNPLYIIRDGELDVIKSDRFSIGGVNRMGREKVFTNHLLEYKTNATCYIFSDGYMDQGGGENLKKFTSVRLQEMLMKIYKDDFKEQKRKVDENLQKWMGETIQKDDILLIGFKVGE